MIKQKVSFESLIDLQIRSKLDRRHLIGQGCLFREPLARDDIKVPANRVNGRSENHYETSHL